ncbi:TetR/AcrR family transcriptional regulator [Leifsonia sp. P73]|uniref:TetR/AcrR family transcriptional regulator n=1 Tax=Leifsonia sp. P73 TaxID=3423959 RepID=UPI003DA499B7
MTAIDIHPEAVGLRERKKFQTRTAIHEAAFRLIDSQGLDATTVEQICHEADVSGRTFFNYFSSKAAAALAFQEPTIHPDVEQAFLADPGSLVMALCEVIGSGSEHGPDLVRMKQLLHRRPELLTTATRIMVEVREMYVDLAARRARSRSEAELAVILVMAALSKVLHDDNASEEPISAQLKATVRQLLALRCDEA